MSAQAATIEAYRTAGRPPFQFAAGRIRKFNRLTEECLAKSGIRLQAEGMSLRPKG
jgi:hypothetical protein